MAFAKTDQNKADFELAPVNGGKVLDLKIYTFKNAARFTDGRSSRRTASRIFYVCAENSALREQEIWCRCAAEETVIYADHSEDQMSNSQVTNFAAPRSIRTDRFQNPNLRRSIRFLSTF